MTMDVRELLPFPVGDNSTNTFIEGVYWNLTTLKYWNYTYYSNGTFSNGSFCFVIFKPYTPYLLENGTFLNGTSCYSPINPLRARSIVGLVFAVLLGFSLIPTLANLRKHGRLFLPSEKRFRAIGRRWQWYWMIVVAALAIISGITEIDVDRYYLPQLPLILTNFFWFLMLPTTMAVVWESVRHWGSWQERQIIDPDPFLLSQYDKRSQTEFYLPLVFYFFFWMVCITFLFLSYLANLWQNFFMVFPRSWTPIEYQRDPGQTKQFAEPAATDIRFKLAAFFLFGEWLTIIYSLHHSIHHYKPRHRGIHNKTGCFIVYTPKKFLLTLPISLAMIGYIAWCAFDFPISPLNLNPNLGLMYGLGWGTTSAIIAIYEIAGYMDTNEDRELIRQRRRRTAKIDLEMGITKKPRWWGILLDDNRPINIHDGILRNVREIGGGQATTKNLEMSIEMGNMPVSKRTDSNPSANSETIRMAGGLLFPATSGSNEGIGSFGDNPARGRGAASNNGSPKSHHNESQDR